MGSLQYHGLTDSCGIADALLGALPCSAGDGRSSGEAGRAVEKSWPCCQSDCAWGMAFLTFVWQIKTTIRYVEEKVSVPAIGSQWFGILFDDFLRSVSTSRPKRLDVYVEATLRRWMKKIPSDGDVDISHQDLICNLLHFEILIKMEISPWKTACVFKGPTFSGLYFSSWI